MRTIPKTLSVVIYVTVAGLAGCGGEDQPQFYRAPKDTNRAATTQPTTTAPVAPREAAVQSADIQWAVPIGWKEMPPQPMRYATFAVAGEQSPVVLTVIPLGPEAGALLPNVNRWEQQLGLPPTPQAELAKVVRRIAVGNLSVDVVDLLGAVPADGTPRERMLAAIFPHGSQVWFFKLKGPESVVTPQKDNFETFLKSIRFGA